MSHCSDLKVRICGKRQVFSSKDFKDRYYFHLKSDLSGPIMEKHQSDLKKGNIFSLLSKFKSRPEDVSSNILSMFFCGHKETINLWKDPISELRKYFPTTAIILLVVFENKTNGHISYFLLKTKTVSWKWLMVADFHFCFYENQFITRW